MASSLFGMGCLTGERMYQRGAFFASQAFRSCGKVGIRVLDFHFSIAFIPPVLRFWCGGSESAGAVGMGESRRLCEISKELRIGRETCLWFSTRSSVPSFPQLSAALACHPPSARTHARNRYPDRAYTT